MQNFNMVMDNALLSCTLGGGGSSSKVEKELIGGGM